MKAFEIAPKDTAAIVGALVADELSWRFRQHMDSLTVASLSPETVIGDGGLALSGPQRTACVARIAGFFGLTDATCLNPGADKIGDWAQIIAIRMREESRGFRFTAAGRDSATQSTRHRADEIFAEAAAVSNLIYGRRRLISLVGPHSLLGFVLTVLAPTLQQIERIDGRGTTPEQLADMLSFGDVVVATPSLWRYLMQEGARAPDNVMGIYFGEPMDVDLSVQMRQSGFGAQREIYGSTETGIIGWRDSPSESFRLFEFIQKTTEGMSRKTPVGDLRKLELIDRIDWRNDRSFLLAGRADGAVQIGAVNVFPEKIAATMTEHQHVETCEISVGRHEGGFDRLIAYIHLPHGIEPSHKIARSLDRYCRERLNPHERPRIYKFEGK